MHLIDLKQNKVVGSLKNHGMAVRALKFTSSSQSLISAGEDLHIFVIDCETNQRKHTLVGHSKHVTDIACHPQNEDVFFSASLDGSIMLWNTQDPAKPQ